jgi:formylglycine-generating enzyme required for sulfatase activity
MNADHPACAVDWYEWMRFCRWLTSQYHGSDENWQCYPDPEQLEKDENGDPRVGRLLVERPGFRMPTESEWELGAHAGQRTAYTFGSDLSLLGDYGWFVDNSPGKRPQVSAVKPPGHGGLHDVQGNMFEWVHDWYGTIEGGSVAVDPQGPTSGQSRGLRGGSWRSAATNCRTASRNRDGPAYRNTNDGFRLALSPSGHNTPEAGTPPQPDNQ